jgi:uncharacterized membrane protein
MSELATTTPSPSPAPDGARRAQLKQLTLAVYLLYAAGFFVGLTAIVAIVINYIKRDDVAGTIYASHFTWQIRTFWWSLLWGIVGGITLLIGVGFVVLLADAVWVIYRIVKGVLNLNEDKPMEIK